MLVPFTAELLPAVRPWFVHPEVRRWLGGPAWPERELRLLESNPGEEFRGRVTLRAHSWVLLDETGAPVAKIGGDVYDRWTVCTAVSDSEATVMSTIDEVTMGLSYVVDPRRWGRGYGRSALIALTEHLDTADVATFVAGIDTLNEASRRCALSAGFTVTDPVPDFEDTVYYARSSTGTVDDGPVNRASRQQPSTRQQQSPRQQLSRSAPDFFDHPAGHAPA